MPPEGYETITLPEELVAEIDERAGEESRAYAIKTALREADGDESVTIASGSVEDIASATASKVVQELENTLR